MKGKTMLLLLGLAVLLAVAAVAYRELSGRVESPDNLSVGQAPQNTQGASAAQEPMRAPDFTVTDAQGNAVSLSDQIGKPVVVNFWASWCGPCKSEMPDFQELYEQYGQSVVFMMVNLTDGSRETVDSAKSFIEEQGYTFPVYFDTEQNAAYTYGIRSIPTTIFIDAQGNVIAGAEGMLDNETLRRGLGMIWQEVE